MIVKNMQQMENFFFWFKKLEPKEKANFLTSAINLIMTVIKLISQIIGYPT